MIGALRRLLEAHSGAMVALVPDEPEDLQLHGAGSLDADDLHVTLAYLGDAADLGADQRKAILAEVRLIASQLQPAECECSAPAVFGGEEQAAVALLQGRELVALRQALERTETVGALMDTETYPVFMPHLTLGYGYPHDAGARQGERFTASHLLVAFGDERHLISLASEEPCCDACGESGGSCERQLEAVAWGAEAAERIVESHSEGWSDLTAEGRRGRWVGALCDLARERPMVGSLSLAAAQLEGMGFPDGAAVLQEAACLPGQRSDLTGCDPKGDAVAQQRISSDKKRILRKRRGSPLTPEQRAEGIKRREQVMGRAIMDDDKAAVAVAQALDNADWWAGRDNDSAAEALAEMARAVEAGDFRRFREAGRERIQLEPDPDAAPPSPDVPEALDVARDLGLVGENFKGGRASYNAALEGDRIFAERKEELKAAEQAQGERFRAAGWEGERFTYAIAREIPGTNARVQYTAYELGPREPFGDVALDHDAFVAYAERAGSQLNVAWELIGADDESEVELTDPAERRAALRVAREMWEQDVLAHLEDGTVVENEPIGGGNSARARLYERLGFGKVDTGNMQYGMAQGGQLVPVQFSRPSRASGVKDEEHRRAAARRRARVTESEAGWPDEALDESPAELLELAAAFAEATAALEGEGDPPPGDPPAAADPPERVTESAPSRRRRRPKRKKKRRR